MEAEYVAYYLGYSMLSKGTTGLGVIQKPLRDKYFAFRKSTENRMGPEVGIRVNPSGLVLVFPGSQPGQENEEFYEISSIHFIEAVRFVALKQKDKKHYGAFVPIDESSAKNASQDKLFVQIEKKSNHLTKISHPAMLACVMRRPTGVKAVDCHMFVIPVVQDALQIADMVHDFQDRPINPDYEHAPPPFRQDRFSNPDVIPRELGQPRDYGSRDSGKRESGEDYSIYRGRGVELRQEHFRKSNDYDDRRPEGLIPETNRSFERERPYNYGTDDRNRASYEADRNRFSGELRARLDDRDREGFDGRRSREYKSGSGFVERDSFGHEFEFDNNIVHERQRSGGEPDRARLGNDRSGEFSPRNDYGGRPERHSADLPPQNRYPEMQQDQNRSPPWQGRAGGGYRDEQQQQQQKREQLRHSYGDPNYVKPFKGQQQSPVVSPRGGRSPPRAQSPPKGHSSPRSRSPTHEDDTFYSASNLESRQETEVTSGKPIAKVPPHRHAGIRVLPSLPIPGAKQQLKPVAAKPPEGSGKDKKEDKAPTYNFDTKEESDEENPYDNAPIKHIPYGNGRQERVLSSDNLQQVERRGGDVTRNDANRVKSDGYNYGYSGGYPNENDNRYGSDKFNNRTEQRPPGRQWSYEDEKEKFLRREKETGWSNKNKNKSASDFQDRSYDSEYTSDRGSNNMKDAEIANMFSNLRTSNGAREVDFERSLGYLP